MPSMARLTLGDGGNASGTESTASWLTSTGDAVCTACSGEPAGGGGTAGAATYPYADRLASVVSSMEMLSACIAWSALLVAERPLVVGPVLLTSLSFLRRVFTGLSSAAREPPAGTVGSVDPLRSASQSSSSCWQCDARRANSVDSIAFKYLVGCDDAGWLCHSWGHTQAPAAVSENLDVLHTTHSIERCALAPSVRARSRVGVSTDGARRLALTYGTRRSRRTASSRHRRMA